MGQLINLDDHRMPWRMIFQVASEHSTLQVYQDIVTGAFEFVQHNNEGESITTSISREAFGKLMAAQLPR